MDRLIVLDKLESLQRCLKRVEAARADSVDVLRGDVDRQDIISLNLARAVQLCVDLAMHLVAERGEPPPRTMGEAFDRLAGMGLIEDPVRRGMRAAVGFRNIAVHSYQDIDWVIVHAITHEHLGDFSAFARVVAGLVDG